MIYWFGGSFYSENGFHIVSWSTRLGFMLLSCTNTPLSWKGCNTFFPQGFYSFRFVIRSVCFVSILWFCGARCFIGLEALSFKRGVGHGKCRSWTVYLTHCHILSLPQIVGLPIYTDHWSAYIPTGNYNYTSPVVHILVTNTQHDNFKKDTGLEVVPEVLLRLFN